MGEDQALLLQSARNLLEQAKMEKDPKRARKLLEGARRLKRWSEEGMPAHLSNPR